MNIRSLLLGSHVLFAREGLTISGTGGGTVSQVYKPVVAAPSDPPVADPNWPEIGIVADCNIMPKITEEDVMGPMPGRLQRLDVLATSSTLDLSITFKQVNELFFEAALLAAGAITGDYQPGVGTGQIRGWIKCQQYDANNVIRNVMDLYVSGVIKTFKADDKSVKPVADFKVIYSALASGTLSLG